MLNTYRQIIVIAVALFTFTSCGEDETPSSAAGQAPREEAGKTVVAPAGTAPAVTPAQVTTETTAAAAPVPSTSQPVPQPEALSHPVVYEDEIYKNWPYTEAPQPAAVEAEAAPEAEELSHQVVYEEEIYKNWPYTEAPQPTTEPAAGAALEKQVETAVTAVEEQVGTVVTGVEEKVETAKAAVAGQAQKIAAAAETHTINAEARAFNPDIVYIEPGDTVAWINMTSHNTVSINGLIPAGASPWRGQIGENLKVTLPVEGIYGYVCEPHIGFGMMGVIVAGKPANLEEVKAYADKNMQGPYRRILGKLNKIQLP